jgi:hypothetical protein
MQKSGSRVNSYVQIVSLKLELVRILLCCSGILYGAPDQVEQLFSASGKLRRECSNRSRLFDRLVSARSAV